MTAERKGTKIILRQSGVEGTPGREIHGIFEVEIDFEYLQHQLRKAAINKSRRAVDGALTVHFTSTSKEAADRYVDTGKL